MSDNSLSRYVERRPSRFVRRPGREARPAYDEARIAATKIDAVAVIATFCMEQAVEVDETRRSLARGDETLNSVLAEFELEAIKKMKQVQNRMFNPLLGDK